MNCLLFFLFCFVRLVLLVGLFVYLFRWLVRLFACFLGCLFVCFVSVCLCVRSLGLFWFVCSIVWFFWFVCLFMWLVGPFVCLFACFLGCLFVCFVLVCLFVRSLGLFFVVRSFLNLFCCTNLFIWLVLVVTLADLPDLVMAKIFSFCTPSSVCQFAKALKGQEIAKRGSLKVILVNLLLSDFQFLKYYHVSWDLWSSTDVSSPISTEFSLLTLVQV